MLEPFRGLPGSISRGAVLRRIYVGATDAEARLHVAGAGAEGLIAGSADTVLDGLGQVQPLGLGEIIVWMNFAGLSLTGVRESMTRFAGRVLPALRGRQLQ